MNLYTLDEVCEFQSGLWTGKKGPYKVVKVLRNTNFTKDNKLNLENIAEIKVEVKQLEKRILEKGDILIEKSGGGPNQPVGRVVFIDKRAVDYSFSNFTSRIRVTSDGLNPNYLYWFLNYIYLSGTTENLQRRSTGIRNLQLKEYKQLVIPVPPLQEQEKIVDKLDKVFENIKNKVDKERNSIELYGKLYKSKLSQIFNNEFMGSGETELGELSEIISGQSPKGEFINDSEGLEFHQGKKAFSDKFLLDSGKRTEYTTKQVPKNTIVMSVRAPVGPVNITQESICIGRGLAGIIPKESNLNFLFYYLDSIKEENTGHIGATINSINRNEIMKIKIPNASIAKQETIANQIEQILELKNELVSNSREVLTKLNNLKESVLSKEFSYE